MVTPELRLGSRPSTTGMLRLLLEDTPEDKRPARLREFFEPLGVRYDAERAGDYAPVEIDLTLQGLPGIQFLSGRMQGARYRRTCASTDPTEDVGLVVNPHGGLLLAQRGRELALGDGEATLISLGESLDATHLPPGGLLVLRVPGPRLVPRLTGAQDSFMRRIPRGSTSLHLLSDYVDLARQAPTFANPDLQSLVVSHLYDLIAVTVGATRDATEMAKGGGLHAARLHAIKEDIALHLHRQDLSVSALAMRHRCTPRSLQRLFEVSGTTFTEYVLTQRLARAHTMLRDPRFDGEKISSVAYDCGFSDISYFNRMFRRSYGAAPSDVRAEPRKTAHNLLK